jgi:hypothetical protein
LLQPRGRDVQMCQLQFTHSRDEASTSLNYLFKVVIVVGVVIIVKVIVEVVVGVRVGGLVVVEGSCANAATYPVKSRAVMVS